MKFRKLLWAAAIALSMSFALNVALPATASAKVVSLVWTCNSDGFEHVVITYEDGTTQEYITNACGPSIAVGGGFNLLLSENTRVSERGQAFLLAMETDGITSPTRVPTREAGAPGSASSGMETIHLRATDVGPHLAGFLTRIAPDWKTESGTTSIAHSIFDRWGKLVTGVVLVPGDMVMTIQLPTIEGERRNARQLCLDKLGTWREKPAGVWGCWTTAR